MGQPATAGTAQPVASSKSSSTKAVVVLPAGFFGDLISNFAGTIGEVAGGAFGASGTGRQVGEALSPIAKLLPFTVIPPSVAPQSAGPKSDQQGPDQAMVVVPAGFLGGLLGGIGGNVLGGVVGGWLGNSQTGGDIGSAAGGILGGLLPFQVLPTALAPQSVGPDGQPKQQQMIVVPAGFFGDLLSGVARTIASSTDNSTVSTIAGIGSQLSSLLPFQEVPPSLLPQSAGPGGTAGSSAQDKMIVVPAGFLGNMLSGLAETVGAAVGGALGNAQTGQAVGAAAKPLLELLPFHTVPPQLAPQSTGPNNGSQQDLMVVPAGLFGGLLSSFAGAIGGAIGSIAGDSQTGQAFGNAAAPFLNLLPFSVVAPRSATAS